MGSVSSHNFFFPVPEGFTANFIPCLASSHSHLSLVWEVPPTERFWRTKEGGTLKGKVYGKFRK